MRWRTLLLSPLLSGCGLTPEAWVTLVGGVSIGSVAVLGRTPFDTAYSAATGKDCPLVRWEQGKSYCRFEDPLPAAPVFCTPSLGTVAGRAPMNCRNLSVRWPTGRSP